MNKTEEKLTDFKIISFNQEIKNESKLNELTFEKSKNALKYIVYVYNSNNSNDWDDRIFISSYEKFINI